MSMIGLGLGCVVATADNGYPVAPADSFQEEPRSGNAARQVEWERAETSPVRAAARRTTNLPAETLTDTQQATMQDRLMEWDMAMVRSRLDAVGQRMDALERNKRLQDDKIKHLERNIKDLQRRR